MTHANRQFGDRPIVTVGTADVLKVLSPIWIEKHETAKRLRQRISTIFDWAKGAGHYPHENPVNGLKKALPTVKRRAEHMAAMLWHDVPKFMAELATREGVSSQVLSVVSPSPIPPFRRIPPIIPLAGLCFHKSCRGHVHVSSMGLGGAYLAQGQVKTGLCRGRGA